MRSSIVPATRSVSTSSTATPESAADAAVAANPQLIRTTSLVTDTRRREPGCERPGKVMAQSIPDHYCRGSVRAKDSSQPIRPSGVVS